MSKVEQQNAFLKDVAKLILEAEKFELVITGGELYRTQYQQDFYFKTGSSMVNHSIHQDRMAIDFNFFKKNAFGKLELTYKVEDTKPLGDFWEQLCPQNKWGGRWKNPIDTPHFQRNELQ